MVHSAGTGPIWSGGVRSCVPILKGGLLPACAIRLLYEMHKDGKPKKQSTPPLIVSKKRKEAVTEETKSAINEKGRFDLALTLTWPLAKLGVQCECL
jgi:hypothetical protein